MFEPFVMKVDESQVMRGVVFEPDDHELRFYQYLFDIVERTWEWKHSHWELKCWDEWKKIEEGDVICIDMFRHRQPYIIPADVIAENWINKKYSTRFPSEFEFIFKDNEWEYHIAESRGSSWMIYEDFFQQEFEQLDEECEEEDDWSWFYQELEKRTFTYIKDFEFLDLSN